MAAASHHGSSSTPRAGKRCRDPSRGRTNRPTRRRGLRWARARTWAASPTPFSSSDASRSPPTPPVLLSREPAAREYIPVEVRGVAIGKAALFQALPGRGSPRLWPRPTLRLARWDRGRRHAHGAPSSLPLPGRYPVFTWPTHNSRQRRTTRCPSPLPGASTRDPCLPGGGCSSSRVLGAALLRRRYPLGELRAVTGTSMLLAYSGLRRGSTTSPHRRARGLLEETCSRVHALMGPRITSAAPDQQQRRMAL